MPIYTVLLVDDEPWALRLMENAFPWRENGFEVVGRCETVEQAVAFLEHQTPHVLLTDIRIAGESGLSIISCAQSLSPDTVCVIVSGFADFEVAKSAIRLNAFDFVLKPIDLEEAAALVQKLRAHLTTQSHPAASQTVSQHFEGRLAFDRVRAVTLLGKAAQDTLFPAGQLIGTDGDVARYILEDTPYLEHSLIEAAGRLKLSLGASAPAPQQAQLCTLLDRADSAAHRVFITMHPDAYFDAPDHPDVIARLAKQLADGQLPPGELYLRLLKLVATMGDLMDLCNRLADCEGFAWDARFANVRALTLAYPDARSLCTAIESRSSADEYNLRYNQAISFLHKHYTKDISLTQIAAQLHVSVSYLSELFSQGSGLNFNRYLTLLRIARACELLDGTSLSIQQVAACAGYQDYFHFCKQFKRQHGVTPSQYRQNSKE